MAKTYKTLLTSKNSAWGVVVKPHGANQYKHTINFPDPSKRDEFIGYELFDGDLNWKDKFNTIPKMSNPRLTEIDAVFLIKLSEYNETFENLVNKDFAILQVYDDVSETHEYLYYTLICNGFNSSEKGIIQFTGELDVLFSYDIKTREESLNPIIRCHTDRYKFSTSLNRYVYNYDGNILREKNLDGIEPYFRQSAYKQKLSSNFKVKNPSLTISQNTTLQNIAWGIVYYKVSDKAKYTQFISSSAAQAGTIILPYRIGIIPIFGYAYQQIYWGSVALNNRWGSIDQFKTLLTDANVISIHVVEKWPFNLFDDFFSVSFTQTTEQNIIFSNPEYTFDRQNGLVYKSNYSTEGVSIINDQPVNTPIINPKNPVGTSYLSPKNINNEVKLWTSQFYKYNLISTTSDVVELDPEWVKWQDYSYIGVKNAFIPDYFYSPQPEKYHDIYLIEMLNQDVYINKTGLNNVDILELPLGTSAYQEYINNNRITSKTSLFGTVGKAGVGGALLATALPIPGGRLAAAGILAASGASKQIAQRADLVLTPKVPKNQSNNVLYYIYANQRSSNNTTYFQPNELVESDKKAVYDYLYQYGYEVNRFENFNNIKQSRYYFNYIQAEDIFNTIDLQVSSKVKQIISEALEQGITFWHYRDHATWKGILNYTYENEEMSFITYEKGQQTSKK